MPFEYLPEDRQYEKILNLEEINRIKDSELRNIRLKYWQLRHEAFINESEISDQQFIIIWDELCKKECREMDAYKAKRSTIDGSC